MTDAEMAGPQADDQALYEQIFMLKDMVMSRGEGEGGKEEGSGRGKAREGGREQALIALERVT